MLETSIYSDAPVSERPTLCIINYNGARHLPASLGAAYAQRHSFAAMLLIDNASQDNGLALVREQFPEVRVIPLAKNHGPAVARNVGFALAPTQRILFLDNDVCLAENTLAALSHALDQHPCAAVAMPRVLYAHNLHTIQYEGAECHFLGLMTLLGADQPVANQPTHTRPIGSVVTASFLLDRARWGTGQPFDNNFLFNYEDHDFGVHTRSRGHQILAVPEAQVYHGTGTAGLSFRRGGGYAHTRVFCLIRNRWLIVLKHYQLRTLLLLWPAFALYELFQLLAVLKKGWLMQWLQALAWVVTHLPTIAQQRAAIQRRRTIPDRELLSAGPLPFSAELSNNWLERSAQQLLDRAVGAYWRIVVGLL